MNIPSPRLVQLQPPLGWPPRHLGGMTDGLATRWCPRSRAQIIGSAPRVQLAVTPGGSVHGYPAGSSARWRPARQVQSSIIAQAGTLYSYALPAASRTRASAVGRVF